MLSEFYERVADRQPVAFGRRRKKCLELGWHFVRRRVRLRLLFRHERFQLGHNLRIFKRLKRRHLLFGAAARA